ncbi:MAG: peptidase [Verrucomicrobia bacterium]|jgi:protease I|nr:peptidase [Verrucomicrobiota bacterium]
MKLRLLSVGLLGLCAFASAAGLIDNKNQASISSGADKPENAKKPKVLVVIGDATELLDTMYPVYRLQEAGFQPVFATPEKRVYQTVLHEVKPGWTITKEWEGYTINSDIAFKDIKPEEYVGIFFSGGRAPEYIREDEALLAATRWFWEHGKPMMSVCHGVEIPARAGIVKGLRMATVPKCKFDLEVCGGIFVNAPVVIDRHMVSGRTFHDNGAFVGPWIKMLEAEAAKK